MSDAQQEQTENQNSQQTLSLEELRAEAYKAAQVALQEANSQVKTVSEEDINRVVAERFQQFGRTLAGHQEEDAVDPLLRKLVTSPADTLAGVADVVAERIERNIEAKEQAKREMDAAFTDLFRNRPDIAKSDANLRLVDTYFRSADIQKPIADRVKDAVRQFDLILEEQGLGDASARIAKAASISSASAGVSQPQGNKMNETELLKQEQDERLSRFRKARNQNL